MLDVAKEVEGEVFVEAKGPRVGDQIGEWFVSVKHFSSRTVIAKLIFDIVRFIPSFSSNKLNWCDFI